MKVGIISDIHGNHYALEAVLTEAKKEGVQRLLVLGDLVGYYYHPELVLEQLNDWQFDIIKGNHEQMLQDLYEKRIDSSILQRKYGYGHENALNNLDKSDLQMLFSLPIQKSVVIDQISFQLNHGSPWNTNEYLYPDSHVKKLEMCNSSNHDFVLIGHSHYPFTYQCSNSLLINCGSVGQLRQKGGVASWCIVDTEDKSYGIKFTEYDTGSLINELKESTKSNEYAIRILQR